MKESSRWKPFYPIVYLYVFLTGLVLSGSSFLKDWGFDRQVIIIGNLIVFVATILSCLISLQGIRAKTGHGVVRGIYGSFMIKFFICIIAAFIYIMLAKKNLNKPALFTCMGLYLVYTFLEVSILTKLSNQKKNA